MRGERLDNPARRPGRFAFQLARLLGFGGQHENRNTFAGGYCPHAANEADPVQVRHVQVGDHEMDGSGQLAERILAVHGLDHRIAGVGERERNHLPHTGRIVDGEDHLGHGSLLNDQSREPLKAGFTRGSGSRVRYPYGHSGPRTARLASGGPQQLH